MKVLLIQPGQKNGVGFRVMAQVEPLGLEMVAGALEKEHDVQILDLRLGGDPVREVQRFGADAVGISCSFTTDVYMARQVASAVKATANRPFVFIGGHHTSLNPQDFAHDEIDAVVIGEGETTAPDLLRTLESGGDLSLVRGLALKTPEGQQLTEPRPLLDNLDDLPLPNRTFSGRNKYFLNLWRPLALAESARGCPYECNFCSVWNFYQGRCRTKSPERVIEELSRVREHWVMFVDDNFLLNPKRALRIAELLKESGIKKHYSIQCRSDTIATHPDLIKQLREVGLGHCFIGIEKIDEEGLRKVNKHNKLENNEKAIDFLRSLGIGITASMIVDPDYGHLEFENLRQYMRKHHIYTPFFTILTPLPGTQLFRQAQEKLETTNYELFDLLHAVLPTKLDAAEFYKEFASLYRGAYPMGKVLRERALVLIRDMLAGRQNPWHIRRIVKGAHVMSDPKWYLSMIPEFAAGQSK